MCEHHLVAEGGVRTVAARYRLKLYSTAVGHKVPAAGLLLLCDAAVGAVHLGKLKLKYGR